MVASWLWERAPVNEGASVSVWVIVRPIVGRWAGMFRAA